MSKQTAIEVLISKLPMVNDSDPYLAKIIEQAKEMERQHIELAWKSGDTNGRIGIMKNAEQYYNEIYKK